MVSYFFYVRSSVVLINRMSFWSQSICVYIPAFSVINCGPQSNYLISVKLGYLISKMRVIVMLLMGLCVHGDQYTVDNIWVTQAIQFQPYCFFTNKKNKQAQWSNSGTRWNNHINVYSDVTYSLILSWKSRTLSEYLKLVTLAVILPRGRNNIRNALYFGLLIRVV